MLLTSSSDSQDAAVRAGKLKLLGVSTAKPSPLMPGAPTIGESLPDFEVNVWFGILAPAGTPAPVIDKLNAAIRQVLSDPELQKKFMGYGCIATASTPPALQQALNADMRVALAQPATNQRLVELGTTPRGLTLPEIRAYFAVESERWTRVIRAADLRVD